MKHQRSDPQIILHNSEVLHLQRSLFLVAERLAEGLAWNALGNLQILQQIHTDKQFVSMVVVQQQVPLYQYLLAYWVVGGGRAEDMSAPLGQHSGSLSVVKDHTTITATTGDHISILPKS